MGGVRGWLLRVLDCWIAACGYDYNNWFLTSKQLDDGESNAEVYRQYIRFILLSDGSEDALIPVATPSLSHFLLLQ